ncbi:hypothetical protein ACFX1T_008755 [Malus domestica]
MLNSGLERVLERRRDSVLFSSKENEKNDSVIVVNRVKTIEWWWCMNSILAGSTALQSISVYYQTWKHNFDKFKSSSTRAKSDYCVRICLRSGYVDWVVIMKTKMMHRQSATTNLFSGYGTLPLVVRLWNRTIDM